MQIYVPPRGPLSARIMIVGEAPGDDEVRERKPFVGYSGMEMARMMHEAGLLEHDCFVTNVLRFRPPNGKWDRYGMWQHSNDPKSRFNEEHYITAKKTTGKLKKWELYNGRYCSPDGLKHIHDLEAEIAEIKPTLIIAFGDLALWAVTGQSGITKWRGSVLQSRFGIKTVPTLHPAAVMRLWSARPIVVHDLKRAKSESSFPEVRKTYFDFSIRPNFEAAKDFLQEILSSLNKEPTHISCDIETRARQIACLGLATSKHKAICIPFMCLDRPAGYWNADEELILVKLIRAVLLHPNAKISGQNFLYDAQYLAKQWGFLPKIWLDTMVIQHVLFPDLPRILKPKSLGFLATMYCENPQFWKDEGKLWEPSMGEEQLWEYNCKDAVATYEIAEEMAGLPEKMGVEYAARFQMRLWRPILRMMLRGIKQDLTARRALQSEMRAYMSKLQARIDKIAGHPLNTRSAPQLKAFFYKDLQMTPVKKKGTGADTLDDAALETIARKEPILKPLITTIQHHRSAGVYASNFVDMRVDTDNRMRTSINIAQAKTFRFATSGDAFGSGGNLQNPPRNNIARYVYEAGGNVTAKELATILGATEAKVLKEAQEGIDDGFLVKNGDMLICDYALPNIRKLFIPDEGYIIGDIDLDRADLQVVVWEADDDELKQMLREGVDIHNENAKVVKLSRQDSKIFCHATNYGASAKKLAPLFRKTAHEMETARKRWFGAHPGIERWHRRTAAQLPKITNKFGYRIVFFDRTDTLLPKALAWVPQSTVAIVINHALVEIDEKLPDVELLLQIHDSLVFQTKKEKINEALPKALELSRVVIPYDDPLIIPVSVKISDKSWGDCKEWKQETR